jgi:hypothetical protein
VATAQASYKALVGERVAPVLRQQGFTGSGNEFVLPDDQDWFADWLPEVKSRDSDSRQVQFTVNLQVMPKWQLRTKPNANESRPGAWTKRLFEQLPGQEEQDWWELRADATDAEVAAPAGEVVAALVQRRVPALIANKGVDPAPTQRQQVPYPRSRTLVTHPGPARTRCLPLQLLAETPG